MECACGTLNSCALTVHSVYLMFDHLIEQRGACSAVLMDSSFSKQSIWDLDLRISQPMTVTWWRSVSPKALQNKKRRIRKWQCCCQIMKRRKNTEQWDEGLYKGLHKKQYRTAGVVTEQGKIPKAVQSPKRIHSIPSTSTLSERIFYKEDFIVSKARSTFLPGNVNKLVLLAHNLKKYQADTGLVKDWLLLFDRIG